MAVTESLKHRFNRGLQPNLSFFRDSRGLECDLFYETGHGIHAIETKAGSTVAPDYFTSIKRVAELIPAVSAKSVVYGGKERQSRSDYQVVPLDELAGLLERFDLKQDLEAFVKERRGPEPDDSDVRTLDAAYFTYILPILDAMDSACRPLGEELFGRFARIGYAKSGRRTGVQDGEVLDASGWERAKTGCLVGRGFGLRDDRPIELKKEYVFTGYSGSSDVDFDIRLSIAWSIGSELVERSVSVNESPLRELDASVPHHQIGKEAVDVDHVVARALQRLLEEIASSSVG